MFTPIFQDIQTDLGPQTTKTYKIDLVNKRVLGKVDGLEGIKQYIYKVLTTERQSFLIYSRNYGTELERFIGKSKEFTLADIERTITDALLYDKRIKSISNFKINADKDDSLSISFTVKTIFGESEIGGDIKI